MRERNVDWKKRELTFKIFECDFCTFSQVCEEWKMLSEILRDECELWRQANDVCFKGS